MSDEMVDAEIYWRALPAGTNAMIPAHIPALAITLELGEDGVAQVNGFLLNGLGDQSDVMPKVAHMLRQLAASADRIAVEFASMHSEWVESPEYLMTRLERGLTLTGDEDG